MTTHVKTTDHDDGGCQVCDECDYPALHRGDCDCNCYDCDYPLATYHSLTSLLP